LTTTTTTETLLARIRSEYREMPGLQLTVMQVGRLMGVDRTTCASLLAELAGEGFLREDGGRFLIASTDVCGWRPRSSADDPAEFGPAAA
jgi:DNA-binding IclR family transcriptional regulator